jgi:N-methylhydantoinase A
MTYRIAIDVGGTFTDVVVFDNDTSDVSFHKVATTPDDPGRGIIDGFRAAGVPVAEITHFVHGTTLGLNALLTRSGARTAIVTTAGFRDVYLLGRTDRRPMYDFFYRKPDSLVQRYDIFEVPERLDRRGEVLRPFDEDAARRVARQVVAAEVDAVAVCFLHSYRNPDHEREMARVLAEEAAGVEVTISSDLSREIREYERTSTAVIDAYIKPIVRRYLERLQRTLADEGFTGQFLMTRSGGGAMSVRSAVAAPVNLVLSGPAGGLLGASWLSQSTGEPNLITMDMGGTSIDVSLVVDGDPVRHFAADFAGLPINVASLFIDTIGAGGGSIVALDAAGHLHVGPESAGATPGPASYGRGGLLPTFTDAAVVVGYLGDDTPLAGDLRLDVEAAHRVIAGVAEPLGMSVEDVALGVIRITVTKTMGAVRGMTVERGHDPADFAMLAFGGGGGMIAADTARELGVRRVVVPPGSGTFSAFGMLMANVQHDLAVTRIGLLAELDPVELSADLAALQAEAAASLVDDGYGENDHVFLVSADLRYLGQEHSVTLPLDGASGGASGGAFDAAELEAAFAAAHDQAYGHTMPDPVEIVAIRVTGIGVGEYPMLPEQEDTLGAAPAPTGHREVYVGGGVRQTYAVHDRSALLPGHTIAGPAIVSDAISTTVIAAADTVRVGGHGELVITVGEESR